eukprot:m.56675 g.56675  ORF g.56675 m.56675 type:complete len:265 (+) comp9315_c0_seq1:476-1270(+)
MPPDPTVHVEGRIVTQGDVLSEEECRRLIAESEAAGFKPSPLSGGGHGRTGREGARTSQFRVVEDQSLAEVLWSRVRAAVPADLRGIKPVPYMSSVTRGDEFAAVGVSPHLRFYKYAPGQHILKHDDYRMSRWRYDPETSTYYQQMTFLTLLVYLNEDFEDGCTAFWTKYATTDSKGHCRFLRESDFTEADLRLKPVRGTALLNDHMVQHEGEAPRKGTKYILRTDILHEKEVASSQVTEKFKKGQTLGEWTRHFEPSCLHYTE